MFRFLAQGILRFWILILIGWIALFSILQYTAPNWEKVVSQGEFAFLAEDAPSRVAQRKLETTFPQANYGSSLLFLIEAKDRRLTDEDLQFVDEYLIPLARETAEKTGANSVVNTVSPNFPIVGELLQNDTGQAALALIQLSHEFLHEDVWRYVNELQGQVETLQNKPETPDGLSIFLSGSAVLGKDITSYRAASASWIQDYAVWLVVVLLLAVFRAPLIALIPLITLSIAVKVSLVLLSHMAEAGWITLFDGIEVYLTVIAYGAGVDYSMFLISRYQEELARQQKIQTALRNSIEQTGNAIAASACTEILGIAMLAFASYGKLSQSGVAIAISLGVMLFASLTFLPSLLRAGQRWAFWPIQPNYQPEQAAKKRSASSVVERFWQRMGLFVVSRPRSLLLLSLGIVVVPAIVGVKTADNLTYGLFEELPKDSTSRISLRALQRNFSVGTVAPVTVLIENSRVDFNSPESEEQLDQWTQNLMKRKDDLNLTNIQNFAAPLGVHEDPPDLAFSPMMEFIESEIASYEAAKYFVSNQRDSDGTVTRASLTLAIDPFSRQAISSLDSLQEALIKELPSELREGASVYLAGPTASLRSMQQVAKHDRLLIYTLVTVAVWLVLVILLRKLLVPIYLIASVVLTFTITLGVTWCVFRLALGDAFAGIDWSVPILLFTLLMAVGADYNVLLVSRSDEEIERSRLKRGIVQAITSTGSVITGCGIVMAGTFATLLIGGELTSMKQLGFALAFAVLLDTFVVRTLLVPPFLLLQGIWFGEQGRQQKSAESDGSHAETPTSE